MLTLKIALATKIALGAVPAAAINNFVTNGQFEATPLASSSQVGNGFAQAATGWTSNGFNLLYIGGTQTTTSAANQYSDRLTYFRSGVTPPTRSAPVVTSRRSTAIRTFTVRFSKRLPG